MRYLLRWAWPFLALSVLFEAYSYQLFYNSLSGASLFGNPMFLLGFFIGIFIGDSPSILIVAAIVIGVYWAYSRAISVRLVAVSFGIGCLATAAVVRPLLTAYYAH